MDNKNDQIFLHTTSYYNAADMALAKNFIESFKSNGDIKPINQLSKEEIERNLKLCFDYIRSSGGFKSYMNGFDKISDARFMATKFINEFINECLVDDGDFYISYKQHGADEKENTHKTHYCYGHHCCLCAHFAHTSNNISCNSGYKEATKAAIEYRYKNLKNLTETELNIMRRWLEENGTTFTSISDSKESSIPTEVKAEFDREKKLKEYEEFARLVADYIFSDEPKEDNLEFFCQIACRKLNILGIIESEGKSWVYDNEVPNLFDSGNGDDTDE